MDYLLQLQNFAGTFLSNLTAGLPKLPDVTVNLPETVGDINLGSTFGDQGSTFGDLGSTFGSGDFGSSNFLNPDLGSDLTSNPGLGSSNLLNPDLGSGGLNLSGLAVPGSA